ncbi:hypothetical protein D7Y13_22440 [Corallococcus praedator]|uniref:Tetratricopeptide repeat protein n=1 Tax=Corallococcus praedator TaxID=2316724 RepID=A0ABX9QGV1_9BACT|nr:MULTISPECIES: hypothetical protein [Corallococcus]RKH25923.1 hypothetical protein D7X75_29285 [Corallococcus sp. CA031C]RKI03300.1 hypothetical protein D7Y13_22440 [Corallococcus praedator]
MGPVEYFTCGRCGGTANVLLRHRSDFDFQQRLTGALRFPLTGPGLQTLLAVSLMLAVLRSLGGGIRLIQVLPLTLALGIFWATFFALVKGAARGNPDPEAPVFTDVIRDNLIPGLRGLIVTVGVFLPAFARAVSLAPSPREHLLNLLLGAPLEAVMPPDALADPLTWGLVLLGFLWLPWAWLVAAMGQSMVGALHPLRALACIRALGRDALKVMGVFALLAVAHAGMHWQADQVLAFHIFFLSRWIAEALTLLVPFAAANVLGLVLYVYGDALGYLPASDFLEPVLGTTAPERVPLPLRGAAPEVPEPEAPSSPEEVASQVAAFTQAVETRDVARALGLYAALRVLPRLKLSPTHHLFVGQAAAVERDFPLSVAALEAAADAAPEEPTAPRALVLLARVQGEKMGNTVRAEEIYRYILHRYPDTDAARFAQGRVTSAA